ncbi:MULTISPECIES: DUF2637 domain-containing protein [Streptomyces]|uniref:DUF2637 domain-containing protein n=1 Tax=Streptomyces doudnae TaxID=3075536 RepID=A0ABD5EYH1_9ACTN|nr:MULTISPECIES: DUF2637 domain-containing protein [unclassified Streptomyces]MDT0439705.1 DUF2637 domain-containing protein [Streptomyces sp. DSM 41981]MYQ69357.1 DUF2637 domain-containing protein [Streptomyces sp. SID4950]SCE53062.1 Protein of unknown function [Streptomyces sp. SolWspMP-5a-2]
MRAQLARVDAVLVQAVIAAALSFAHLHDVASAAGQDGWKAWAYPVSVDLLLVAAWRRLRTSDAKAAGWCWFAIALAASLGANVATAGLLDMDHVPAWLRILVAGWPAIGFLGGTLLAHSTPKPTRTPTQHDATEEQRHEPEDIDDQEDAPDSVPALPSPPVTESVPAALSPPAVPVPAALVEHARKVATEHHARTGTAIDTTTLRARLGVPLPMADAIAAQL